MVIYNIGSLVQVESSGRKNKVSGTDLASIPSVSNAYLRFDGNRIMDYGPMEQCPPRNEDDIDARGGMVFPCWCDSHTHLVFAGSREGEFVDRINGLSYQDIAKKGGGIVNSALRLRDTPEDELLESTYARLEEIIALGTGAVEIKSGYGLSLESELKMLRVIKRLKSLSPIPIKATFLGAHAIPPEFKHDRKGYVDLIVKEMIPRVAEENLADYIDVFCEKVAFSPNETEEIIQVGSRHGLVAKVHTNQFYSLGGIQVCVRNKALSVDHLEVVNEEEIQALKGSATMPTLLPSAPFFLNDHYPPAREIIDAGLPVALASDFNPGSTPSGNMPFVISLACIKMKMTPEEAINAATINGAYAMGLHKDLGSIAVGKLANIFITKKIPSLAYLPYAFGSNLIEQVIINGKLIS